MKVRTQLLLAGAPLAIALVVRRRVRGAVDRVPRPLVAVDPRAELPQRAGRPAHEGGARAHRRRRLLRRNRPSRARRTAHRRRPQRVREGAARRGGQHHRAGRGRARRTRCAREWNEYQARIDSCVALGSGEPGVDLLLPRSAARASHRCAATPIACSRSTRTPWRSSPSARDARRSAPARRWRSRCSTALALGLALSSWLATRGTAPARGARPDSRAVRTRRLRGARAGARRRRGRAARRTASTRWPIASASTSAARSARCSRRSSPPRARSTASPIRCSYSRRTARSRA